MKSKLIVALDLKTAREAELAVMRLPRAIKYCKVGLQLFIGEGPPVVRMLRRMDKEVFLDLKLHDIPNTVAAAVASAAALDVAFLTVHACGGRAMLRAAAEAAANSGRWPPKLLAVTALTSLGQDDLAELGIARGIGEHVPAMAGMAAECGIDGVVASAREAAKLRNRFGAALTIVTPGVRPPGKDVSDQKRVTTPAEAVRAGADYLVVGRPILDAADPAGAAEQILNEMQQEEESCQKTR